MKYIVCIVAGALLLCMPSVLNGVPFLFWDSISYLNRPDASVQLIAEKLGYAYPGIFEVSSQPDVSDYVAGANGSQPAPVITGRSIYYGFVAYASYLLGGLWPLVVMQAVFTAGILGILYFRVMDCKSFAGFVILLGGLAWLSPLGFFTGLAMPDAWAPLLILSVAICITTWAKLSWSEKSLLTIVTLFSMISHTSHIAIAVGLIMSALIGKALLPALRPYISGKALSALSVTFLVAMFAKLAFGFTIEKTTGFPPISRPHLTAHLIDGGPGVDYLIENCPEAEFELCNYLDRLPMDWSFFLFEADPELGIFGSATPEVQRSLAAEHGRFAATVAAESPLALTGFAAKAFLKQLVWFNVEDIQLTPDSDHAGFSRERLPKELSAKTINSVVYNNPPIMTALTRITYATSILSVLVVMWSVTTIDADNQLLSGPSVLILILILGLLGNAAICGILASPYPRFQARVICLLPLIAFLAAVLTGKLQNGVFSLWRRTPHSVY